MIAEADEAGVYEYQGVSYDRLQLLTILDILEEKREFHTPSKVQTNAIIGAQYPTPRINVCRPPV